MPYCTACGSEVDVAWRYCNQCGTALSERADDEETPAPASHRFGDGFLSGRSLEYVTDLADGDTVDPESPEFVELSRNVRAALRDFALLAAVEQLNMVLLFAGAGTETESEETDRELASLGLVRLPELYDRVLGTDWRDEFGERLDTLLEEVREEVGDGDTEPE